MIVGIAGGDGPIRSYIAAFDAKTGKEAWRFYTIPGPGEPGTSKPGRAIPGKPARGGLEHWRLRSDSNLTFWGIGNPAPDTNGDIRLGDNLYSDCVVALDADTGKLKWYYQFTPHDTMDYDATQVPVLADIEYKGRPRKAMIWANRNGVFYVLDRTTGEFLMGKPFVKANWLTGFDEKGRPMRTPGQQDSPTPVLIQPNGLGGTNWYPPSYSPHTGLFYIPGWENSGPYSPRARDSAAPPATLPWRSPILLSISKTPEDGFGIVRAFDPKTGDMKWEYKMTDITWAGVLSTAPISSSAARAMATFLRWTAGTETCCGSRASAGR